MFDYVMFDKIIDIKLYKYSETDKDRQGSLLEGEWSANGTITKSHEYINGDGTVFSIVQSNYVNILTIKCENCGLKPDIVLHMETVPGRTVTECTLRITGLQLNNELLRDCDLMEIEAGYRGNNSYVKTTLLVNVFSAWTEKPAPDGITCIKGICTGGAIGRYFGQRSYNIKFATPTVTMRTLLYRLLANEDVLNIPMFQQDVEETFLSQKIKLYSGPTVEPQEYTIGDLTINTGLMTVRAANGYQILQWLSRELFNWGKSKGVYIYTHIFNDRVRINVCGAEDSDVGYEDVVVLKNIDSAVYTAKVLTIKAPWTPSLIPGGLFYLNSKYFSLENTYKSLKVSDITDSRGLYRVITMRVDFATNDNKNQMQILAIPYTSAPNPWNDNSKTIAFEKDEGVSLNDDRWLNSTRGSNLLTTIVFGEDTDLQYIDEDEEGEVVEDVTPKTVWTKWSGIGIPSGHKTQDVVLLKPIYTTSRYSDLYNNRSPKIVTGFNWYQIWRNSIKTDNNATLDNPVVILKDAKSCNIPYLKNSELKAICTQATADGFITPSLKNRLSKTSFFTGPGDVGFLRPNCLWIIYFISCYIISDTGDNKWLSQSVDKSRFSHMQKSALNYLYGDKVNEYWKKELSRLQRSDLSNTSLDNWEGNLYTVPVDGKYLQPLTLSIDTKLNVNASVESSYQGTGGGGLRKPWGDAYKDYIDIFKIIFQELINLKNADYISNNLDDLIIWYYFLKEGMYEN